MKRQPDSLAEIAGIDVEEFAHEMFNAGSNLDKARRQKRSVSWISNSLQVGDTTFGVGQVNSMSATELGEIKEKVESYLDTARSRSWSEYDLSDADQYCNRIYGAALCRGQCKRTDHCGL